LPDYPATIKKFATLVFSKNDAKAQCVSPLFCHKALRHLSKEFARQFGAKAQTSCTILVRMRRARRLRQSPDALPDFSPVQLQLGTVR
jgi:hypothetical protein